MDKSCDQGVGCIHNSELLRTVIKDAAHLSCNQLLLELGYGRTLIQSVIKLHMGRGVEGAWGQ